MNGAAAQPGHSLNIAFQRRVAGAAEDCKAASISFVPLVLESLGGWHEVAVAQVAELGRCRARQEGTVVLWNNRVLDIAS